MFTKKRILIAMVVVVVIGVTVYAAMQANVADVRLEAVRKGDMREFIEVRGRVELENQRTVYSRLSGVIDEVKAKEGDSVQENDPLVKIDVENLGIALDKAQAAYDAAKASLEELKSSIKPEQIKQAEAQLEQTRIALEAVQKDYNHKKEQYEKTTLLYENKAVSEQELKSAELQVVAAERTLGDAQQAVKVAQYNLDMLKQGVSQSAIEAAEAQVEQARLQMEELRNNIGKASVYSEIKGTVLTKYVEKGMAVQPGTPLYEIGDFDSAYIRVDVLADDAADIKLGQKAILSGEVLNDHEIEGVIDYIAPKAESSVSSLGVEQQRIEMRIRYDNGKVSLKPGYGVDVDIITREKQEVLLVPDKAVFDMDGKEYVFVVKDGKLELREVEIGLENDDNVEIVKGLAEGEQVVVDPENELKPGMKVKGSAV